MKLTIDTESKTLHVESDSGMRSVPLYSDAAFELISDQWLKVGWNQRYPYTFSWMGRPIIQIPEDIVRMQEVIFASRPEVIVETGVAHGGSLVFYASLLKMMDIPGKIVGVDVEIRKHNRTAIEAHPLASYISLVEGDSTAKETVEKVKAQVDAGKRVLVVLDSCHTLAHVRRELEAYHAMVSLGSYIVATDGSMRDFYDVPLGKPEWVKDNPATAAEEFAAAHPEFTLEQPRWLFNESKLHKNITHWPSAFLKRNRV